MSFVIGEDTGANSQSGCDKYIDGDLLSVTVGSAVEWNLVYLKMDVVIFKE